MSDLNDQIQAVLGKPTSSGSSLSDQIDQVLQPNNPSDVSNAVKDIGDQNYNGWCQAFVEQVGGVRPPTPSASAIEAWNSFVKNGQAISGTQGLKPGDLIYFSPATSNNNDGHVGIYQGNNKMVSATDNGVKASDLAQWQEENGQQIMGYVPQGGLQ